MQYKWLLEGLIRFNTGPRPDIKILIQLYFFQFFNICMFLGTILIKKSSYHLTFISALIPQCSAWAKITKMPSQFFKPKLHLKYKLYKCQNYTIIQLSFKNNLCIHQFIIIEDILYCLYLAMDNMMLSQINPHTYSICWPITCETHVWGHSETVSLLHCLSTRELLNLSTVKKNKG